MKLRIRDTKENRILKKSECFGLVINCGSGGIYKYNKRTYYGSDPFIAVSDRYVIEKIKKE